VALAVLADALDDAEKSAIDFDDIDADSKLAEITNFRG
jgi:hypothetical protein